MHAPGASQPPWYGHPPAGPMPPFASIYGLHFFYPSRRAASATYSVLGRRSSRNDNRCLANAWPMLPLPSTPFLNPDFLLAPAQSRLWMCCCQGGLVLSRSRKRKFAWVGVGVADCFPRGAAWGGWRPEEQRARLVTGVRPREKPGQVPQPEDISGNECGKPVSNHAA